MHEKWITKNYNYCQNENDISPSWTVSSTMSP